MRLHIFGTDFLPIRCVAHPTRGSLFSIVDTLDALSLPESAIDVVPLSEREVGLYEGEVLHTMTELGFYRMLHGAGLIEDTPEALITKRLRGQVVPVELEGFISAPAGSSAEAIST